MVTRILKILLFVAIALTSISCHKYIRINPDLPIDKFLHVSKYLHVTTCVGVPGRAESDKGCEEKKMHRSVASAFIIKTIDIGAYVVTAAHVCEENEEREALKKAAETNNAKLDIEPIYFLTTVGGKRYKAKVLTYTRDIDICLMYASGLTHIKAVKIAQKAPQKGDRVYNIGAPYGIFEAGGFVPILEGIYNGTYSSSSRVTRAASYSIMAAPGSSGSMIINHRGELVGVLHSVFWKFPTLVLAVRYDDMKAFINNNIAKYEEYRSVMHRLGLKNIFDY